MGTNRLDFFNFLFFSDAKNTSEHRGHSASTSERHSQFTNYWSNITYLRGYR